MMQLSEQRDFPIQLEDKFRGLRMEPGQVAIKERRKQKITLERQRRRQKQK